MSKRKIKWHELASEELIFHARNDALNQMQQIYELVDKKSGRRKIGLPRILQSNPLIYWWTIRNYTVYLSADSQELVVHHVGYTSTGQERKNCEQIAILRSK